ncbi:LysR family transcriptional regulator [Adlercreutzia sp. ZJ154]|uniref:LysR family transcriptional regulator n=1 Tax=Adlercreutzia sp. ZJ154 TaxID=2709790 RepID=UPI0013EA42B1|nr:LysR family transcriptional regulator [Adlercreutzia sp. ZJ154]
MITIEQLECFMLASETLNFTITAKKLYMTQPAVTHQMKNLETEIGVELFKRNGHRLSLTPAGIELREGFSSILPSLKRTIEQVQHSKARPFTIFSLGCSPSLISKWLSIAIGTYNIQHKEGKVVIRSDDALALPALVETHALDAAICIENELENSENLTFTPIFSTPFRLFCPAFDTLTSHDTISPRDLEDRSVIVYEGGGGVRKQLGKGFSSVVSGGIKFSDILPVKDAATGIIMAASNLGVYIGLEAEEEYAKSFSLESRPLKLNLPSSIIGLVFRSDNKNPIIPEIITLLGKDHVK